VATALAFAVMAAWSVAMPRFSGPDEPSQVIHAAAVVRGQFVGTPLGGAEDAYTDVRIPAALANGIVLVKCYHWKPTVSASCAHEPPTLVRTVNAGTYSGRYPPLYYAIVGLPTLVVTSPTAILLMRLVSSLISAVFLGLAVMAVGVWSRSRLLAIGVLLALTPMTFYLAAMVNPNGLEICAALCLWVTGLVLVRERIEDPPRGLVAVMTTSAAVLTLSRGVSPVWTFVILVLLATLCGPSLLLTLLRRRRDVQVGLGIVAVCGVLAIIWVVGEHALDLVPAGPTVHAGAPVSAILLKGLGQTESWLQQMVGIFGSLDTSSPLVTYLGWWVAIGAVVLIALGSARRREGTVLVLLIVLFLLLPVLMEYPKATSLGLVWQGRYTLPLAVGIPLLGTAIIGQPGMPARLMARVSGLLAILLPAAGLLAFVEALRRYSVGTGGPIVPWSGGWQPPGGSLLAMVWYAVAIVSFAALLWRISRTGDGEPFRTAVNDEA
jgi:hypothetical protein